MNVAQNETSLRIAMVAGVDVTENPVVKRGEYIIAPDGFGFLGVSRPVIVMHPLDSRALRIAVNTGRRMTDVDVMTEALLDYVAYRARVRATQSVRWLDRLVESGDERTAAQVGMFLHPLEHGMTYDLQKAQAECQECDYVVTDEQAHRFGMRAVL